METLAPKLLESHLGLLFKRKTNFVGSRALDYSIKFVENACRIPCLMTSPQLLLQPYIDNILFETAVPVIIVSSGDAFQFREEPVEFLRREQDSANNIKLSMIELIVMICNYKHDKKDDNPPVYLQPFLQFCLTNLHQYALQLSEARSTGEAVDWRIKEAIVHLLGHLAPTIKAIPYLKPMLEPMMKEHVLPDAMSFGPGSEPYLRYRAIWFYGAVGTYKFSDESHLH